MADVAKSLLEDHEFLTDFARYSEGILDEKFLRKKYHFVDDTAWQKMGADDALVEAIELERVRRMRSGATKRELAQKHITKAPDILNTIMCDERASPKYRIDSAKTLDQFADNGPARTPASDSERFSIVINLGADVPKIKASPDGVEIIEHDADTPPLLAAIAAKKNTGGGSGGEAW